MKPMPVGRDPAGRDPRLARGASVEHGDADNVLRFRRGGSKVRRSRRSPLVKWLLPFVAASGIVALPTGLVTWTMTSPRFALAEVTVVTGEKVSEEWVRGSLRPLLGENLPLLSLTTVEGLLLRHAWIHGADLRKDLPSGLAVHVREKKAVALLRAEQDLYYLDEEGVHIERFDPLAGSADLLLISQGRALAEEASPEAAGPAEKQASGTARLRAAVRLADEIEEIHRSWSTGLSEIEILGEQDFRIYTEMPFPLLVRAGILEDKARRLEEMLPHIAERFGTVAAIDLRFARRIIVQPSVGTGIGRRRSEPATEHREAT